MVSTKTSTARKKPRRQTPAAHTNRFELPDGDRELMTTLAKGLTVMRAFSGERAAMTLSETAAAAELTRATARRILRTLTALGYVAQNGRQFSLTPRVLELGFGYLSSQSWIDQALPLMKDLGADVRESCSMAILQDTDIVYVSRVPTSRIMSVAVTVGSRLPAFHTSLGRAQLGFVDEGEVWRRIMSLRLEPYTTNTIVEPQALLDRIKADREQGFSIVDEELERGLRSIAVPVVDRRGAAVAGLNVSTNSTRITRNHMRDHFLPKLREASEQISSFIA
jgi:IclR family transcriptional regulator, pca regulon regulatory protein